ncbi:protein kinase [Mycobacterium sp. URHB0044]|uniref:protein kinase domain-containing protein n=1 Tax=Mycobacterium sp. URHB0044 TaxID=1380386 RepID=UPI00068738C8|nr:protein kinase [Mycobacterium sp. URHB0044]
MDDEPLTTQRDVGPAVVSELSAAGFSYAEEVGRGGFGIVYRCTQLALDRLVAVKVLTARLGEKRERFLREQRAMGRLTGHPNIVGVLQVGETESGYPYLVMQYHRKGSLEDRIRQIGPLPLDEVVRLGVKMAGALATAHRVGILHRDVKPANILLTDYGEPALSDFGIAHMPGGFATATGTFTGSPAFAAPESLSGDPPSESSDVYGLGATLFAALTGHAAFERRSGEQLVTQFLRIASESAPDLRDTGIPDDISTVVERAMSPHPADRPSAAALGEEIQRIQLRHGYTVDELALPPDPAAGREEPRVVAAGARRHVGNLPLELTTFVGRRGELAEVKGLLSTSRLVTLTGIGGVGKTRLALRAAAEVRRDFPDGVWLVELGELHDGSLLVDVMAESLGIRDESTRSLRDVLVDFLCSRKLLLILDNCEQVVESTAKLTETLLRACPELRILATSREALGIGGEAVLRLAPLAFPSWPGEPTPGTLPDFDAVTLFADRAAAAVPDFRLGDDNTPTVARICSRLDGLPLAIELAAARLRAISTTQLLDRLDDRYALLTQGSRGAPTRQQTLSWSVGWSYDLCTPAEQRLWAELSVFAGSFDLEAAEGICTGDLAPGELLDLVSALVDKSILSRIDAGGATRFRMLETLRDYGCGRIEGDGGLLELHRRHADWFRRFVRDAAADWFGPRQVQWMQRLDREALNIREALEFSLTDAPETALQIVGTIHPFGVARGRFTEIRHWLDRTLAATPAEPTADRINALYGAVAIAALQGDLPAAVAWLEQAQTLVAQMSDVEARGKVAIAEGFVALVSGDSDLACDRFEAALSCIDEPSLRVSAMILLGWCLEFSGEIGRALLWQEKALAVAESHDESVYRGYALWSLGIGWWRHRKPDRAAELLRDALRLNEVVDDPRQAAASLEGLAWIAAEKDDTGRAAVLMAAAQGLGRIVGASTVVLPHLQVFHDQCERRTREALDAEALEAARQEGCAMSFEEAVAYAVAESS